MKNVEIEYKYKVDSHEKITDALKTLGAIYEGEILQKDTYYVLPNNSDGRKYLRVREKNGASEVAFHLARSQSHTDEWETGIDSPEIMKEILEQLGYEIDVVVEKRRKVYKYIDSEIVLDEVVDLGSYMEIESSTLAKLEDVADKLGFAQEMPISKNYGGYPDLLRTKLKKKIQRCPKNAGQ